MEIMEFEKKIPEVMEIMEFGGQVMEIMEFSLKMDGGPSVWLGQKHPPPYLGFRVWLFRFAPCQDTGYATAGMDVSRAEF